MFSLLLVGQEEQNFIIIFTFYCNFFHSAVSSTDCELFVKCIKSTSTFIHLLCLCHETLMHIYTFMLCFVFPLRMIRYRLFTPNKCNTHSEINYDDVVGSILGKSTILQILPYFCYHVTLQFLGRFIFLFLFEYSYM